jgi:cytoskeletal protein CcmA (bactofilin family)
MSAPARGSAQSTFSVLGADVVVTGNIAATVDLHLDGRVEGDISCASLVQGRDSVIRGAVTAEVARLAGTVEGSITAKELVIQASARITGDVTYESLTIEQGSQVDGRFSPKSAAVPKVELVASN